jgi:hypothetical protein
MPCRKETPGVELYDGYLEMQKHTYREENNDLTYVAKQN